MRVDPREHLARPLLIHRLAADFPLLDVWRLPAAARDADDDSAAFERFVGSFPLLRPDSMSRSGATRLLFAVREVLLRLFGVHDTAATDLPIPGCREQSVRERLTTDERVRFALSPEPARKHYFAPVYATADERLYEVSNPTVHALLHLSWVPEQRSHRAYMAVYAKPRGVLGRLYMALISPFRHWVVYPALMKSIARAWQRASVH